MPKVLRTLASMQRQAAYKRAYRASLSVEKRKELSVRAVERRRQKNAQQKKAQEQKIQKERTQQELHCANCRCRSDTIARLKQTPIPQALSRKICEANAGVITQDAFTKNLNNSNTSHSQICKANASVTTQDALATNSHKSNTSQKWKANAGVITQDAFTMPLCRVTEVMVSEIPLVNLEHSYAKRAVIVAISQNDMRRFPSVAGSLSCLPLDDVEESANVDVEADEPVVVKVEPDVHVNGITQNLQEPADVKVDEPVDIKVEADVHVDGMTANSRVTESADADVEADEPVVVKVEADVHVDGLTQNSQDVGTAEDEVTPNSFSSYPRDIELTLQTKEEPISEKSDEDWMNTDSADSDFSFNSGGSIHDSDADYMSEDDLQCIQEKQPKAQPKSQPKSYSCLLCDDVILPHYELRLHGQEAHPGERLFKCEQCDKKYFSLKCLNHHLFLHRETNECHRCSQCDKVFTRLRNLKKHMETHTTETPYQCEICGCKFSQKLRFKYHMVVHTGEKRFECNVCEKRFTQNSNLRIHMRQHTGEKPYKCTVCDSSFSLNLYLKRHMREHTGEQPYPCPWCEKGFTKSSELTKHMETHDEEKSFECKICGSRFFRNCHLSRHMHTHDKKSSEKSKEATRQARGRKAGEDSNKVEKRPKAKLGKKSKGTESPVAKQGVGRITRARNRDNLGQSVISENT